MSEHLTKREQLREQRRQQKRRKTLTFILISLSAIALLALALFLPKLLVKKTSYEGTNGFSIGDPDAPVTVVEFSSYNCGYCKDFSERIEDGFVEEYVNTGKVFFTYVNLAGNNESSISAATASYCAAEQNRFFEYKDLLFTYAAMGDGFSSSNLINYANTAGLDANAFQNCLQSGTYADAYNQDYEYAMSVGITGTPTFLINGEELVSSSQLIPRVEELLAN